MGSYWVASILFLVFRTEMGMVAVPCADGAMSRDCFMNEQPNAYKVRFTKLISRRVPLLTWFFVFVFVFLW